MRPSPIKPKLISPKSKLESYETKKIASPIKPKLISHKRKRVSFKTEKESPVKKINTSPISTKRVSPVIKSPKKQDDKPSESRIKYRKVDVRMILSNYEYPKSKELVINDNRLKIISKYIHLYSHLCNPYDALILASLTQGILLC